MKRTSCILVFLAIAFGLPQLLLAQSSVEFERRWILLEEDCATIPLTIRTVYSGKLNTKQGSFSAGLIQVATPITGGGFIKGFTRQLSSDTSHPVYCPNGGCTVIEDYLSVKNGKIGIKRIEVPILGGATRSWIEIPLTGEVFCGKELPI